MPPRFCCCADCLLLEDNFDRAELGSNWDGSGTITGGVLYANEDSITICHPSEFPLGSVYATMYMIDTDPSRTYQIRVGDPAGDYTVTVTFTGTMGLGTGTMTVTIGDGATTETFDYPWLYEDEYLAVCYEPGVQLSAGIESRGEYAPWVTMCIPLEPSDTCWSGLGNWTFVSGRWDTFYYSAHWIDRKDCPQCDCKCWFIREDETYEVACIPETLYLTISSDDCPDFVDDTYAMNQLHAYSIVLDAYPTVGAWTTKEAWITDAIECPAGGFEFAFILLCGQYSGTDKPKFRLQMVRWEPGTVFYTRFAFDQSNPNSTVVGSPGNSEAFAFTELESTCDPIYLEWPLLIEDAFQSSNSEQSCCGGYIQSGVPPDPGFESDPSTFTIVITE